MHRCPTGIAIALLTALLAGCGGSKSAGGGSVAMRDMEVVDGTANDSMTDLDNVAYDGTALENVTTSAARDRTSASAGDGGAANAAEAARPPGGSPPPGGNGGAPD